MIFDQETGEMFDYSHLVTPPPPRQSHDTYNRQRTAGAQRSAKKRRRHRHKKREITLGYNPTHKLFLIPSLFLFFRITAVVLMFCELVLHIWSHWKNDRNTDKTVFYRSPLHLITGQFCAKCISESGMDKLGTIQDRRREAKQLIKMMAE